MWLVGLDGVVIGDCGTVGPARNGAVEIGFGLAEERRGRGYGTELVIALSNWLLMQAGITSVVASTDVSNAASRHVLERTGFKPAAAREGLARYIRAGTV